MKKGFLFLSLAAASTLIVTACSGANPADARPANAFVIGEANKAGSFQMISTSQVSFFEDNVYELVKTNITYGYSMVLGTSVTVTYGTYAKGATEDGVTAYTLNKAAEALISSYSKAGGFSILVNTADSKQAYPAELPASGEGQKVYANSKDDVINAYGIGTIVYTSKNNISWTDPNGSGDTPAVVNDASGSVSSVLGKFHQVQTVGSMVEAGGFQIFNVNHLHTFEDGSYHYITSSLTYGYSMVLGTTFTSAYGDGLYGSSEDGVTPYTMGYGKDVVLNSYSKAGGFNISINTASASQTYPVELPASGEGQKVYANSKDDVIVKYAPETVVYTSDESNVLSLTNPNA